MRFKSVTEGKRDIFKKSHEVMKFQDAEIEDAMMLHVIYVKHSKYCKLGSLRTL